MPSTQPKNPFVLQTENNLRRVVNSVHPVYTFNSVPGFFVIAHRGASFYAPENTMPAFEKAAEMNADMIELDVLLTRDNIPIVIHDTTIERTTDGNGPVNQLFARELQELDAGSWFDPSYKNTQIPSLETVLQWASGKIALNIEIKGSMTSRNSAGIEGLVLDLISQYGMNKHVIISSFSPNALLRVKKIAPAAPTALLNWKYSYGTMRVYRLMRNCRADSLNLLARQMKPALMNALIKNKVPAWTYTLNDESEMRMAIQKGATGIFSDQPDLLKKVVLDEFQNTVHPS